MCQQFKFVLEANKRIVLNMLKLIVKRILYVTLNDLLWFILFAVFVCVLWVYSGMIGDDSTKLRTPAQYPVILWWTLNFPGNSNIRYCPSGLKCHVYSDGKIDQQYNIGAYLFYASNIDFKNLPLPRKPNDTIWALFHEESPRNVEELLHERTLNLFNFSSTFSRYSDVPFPLQHLQSFDDIKSKKYFVATSLKNELLEEIAPILYLQSDCETSTERDSYVKELMKFIKVDSYGACLKNKDLPSKFTKDYLNNLNEDEFLHFIARYKFVIAIENGVCNDYVTEKFWRAIKVGSVPIYFGSPLIKDWFPNKKSGIILNDYPTPYILFKHIKELLNNNSLYEEYLEHKIKQIITNQKLVEEYFKRPYQLDDIKIIEEFECFICKKLYDRIGGVQSSNVVSKKHYNCPKPISALTLAVNPSNSWVYSWENAEAKANSIYNNVINFIE